MHGSSWLVIGLSIFAAASLSAATADEEYVRIYKAIVDADALREGGQPEAATRNYQAAREALKKLQTEFPGWNERLVIFRLNYIASRLSTTPASPSADRTPASPSTAPTPAPMISIPPPPPSPSPIGTQPVSDQQLQQLRDENQALRLAAARLEAKLREALSTQPAPTDPQELARVQNELRELSKAHELLKSSMAAETSKPPAVQTVTNTITSVITNIVLNTVTNTVTRLITNFVPQVVVNTVTNTITNNLATVVTNRIMVEPPDLAEMRTSLTNQLAAVSALRSENDLLKKELQQAKSTPPPAPVPVKDPVMEQQLASALKSLKAAEESNAELVKRQNALEQKLADASQSQTEAAAKLKETAALEAELNKSREEFKRLADSKAVLEKRLAENVGAKVPESESGRRIMKLERDLLESQAEMRLLTRQKATLEQKLAESRAATPPADAATAASSFPSAGGEAASTEVNRQLKKAAWEVLNLQAANADLTRKQAELITQMAKLSSTSSTADAIDQDRLRRLEQMNQELAQSRSAKTRLEQENQSLARQLTDARQPGGRDSRAKDDTARKQLAEAQDKIKQMEQANRDLLAKASELERQIAEAKVGVPIASTTAGGDAHRIERLQRDLQRSRETARALEQENRALEARLGGGDPGRTGAQPTVRTSGRSANDRELAALRSRLAIYEAKAVPYTEEELSLFGRLEINIATTASEPAPAGGAPSSPSVSSPLVVEARKDFDSGNYAGAEQKFREAVKSDSRNLYALAHLAAAQFEQSKLDDAEKTLAQAVSLSSEDPASLYLLGIIRLRQEKVDEALDYLTRSAKGNPQNAVTQNSLGVALSQKGLREPAETAFRRALQIRPEYPDAHYNLAVEYVLQDPPAFKLAQWHYQKAVEKGHPRNNELEKRLENAAAAGAAPAPEAKPIS
ncbi:MAG: tetratricopeptide repeat protein, partial [Verrucomicrobia bacterium]|nr:tetratricopeptide repeat protein [Verrucomicrobiota bacterium]